MPIWKLEPINPDDDHWGASTYNGPLFVRAADEDIARELATSEYRIGAEKSPWLYAWLTNITRIEDSDYDEDGPDAILGPQEALAKAQQQP